MKLKTKISVILIFLVIAVCSLFAACKIGGKTLDEILGDAKNQCITYYAGGGTFDDSSRVVKNIYYKAGTPTLSDHKIAKTNWLFKGWYYVECDEDGNPKFASEEDKKAGIPVLTDREVTFPLILQENEHLYLGAKWTRDYKIKYILHEDSPSVTVGDKVIEAGQELTDGYFGKFDSVTLSFTRQPVTSQDATLLEYYVKNGDGTYEVPENYKILKPAEYNDNDTDPHVAVYCKYVSGKWEMVRTASDVSTMYQNLAYGKSYYITKDIDCSDNAPLNLKQGSINSTIEGNGYKISGQKFRINNLANGAKCSVFGEISSETSIKDITFENFEATVTIRGKQVNVYLFSHGIQAGATLENVAFNGSTLDITSKPDDAVIENIQNAGEGYTESWIFGEGDHSGVTYDELTLKVKDEILDVK